MTRFPLTASNAADPSLCCSQGLSRGNVSIPAREECRGGRRLEREPVLTINLPPLPFLLSPAAAAAPSTLSGEYPVACGREARSRIKLTTGPPLSFLFRAAAASLTRYAPCSSLNIPC